MQIEMYNGRRNVHQTSIYFKKPEKADHVGDWSNEWTEMFTQLQSAIAMLLSAGYGVLDVNIQKTEPANGIIFVVNVTYWDNP